MSSYTLEDLKEMGIYKVPSQKIEINMHQGLYEQLQRLCQKKKVSIDKYIEMAILLRYEFEEEFKTEKKIFKEFEETKSLNDKDFESGYALGKVFILNEILSRWKEHFYDCINALRLPDGYDPLMAYDEHTINALKGTKQYSARAFKRLVLREGTLGDKFDFETIQSKPLE